MAFHKFIKTKGEDADIIGYCVPRVYRFKSLFHGLRLFGFSYLKDLRGGWYYWWVNEEKYFVNAIEVFDALQEDINFTYRYTE